MANTKISQLPQNNNPTGSEELVYAFNNSNGKMTLNTMASFTQTWMQPALISWITIKTINWEDILWAGNLVISWWGWGSTWTVALNALENITAGMLCSFTWAWVKKLRRWFYGTADTWISLTVWQNQYVMIDSVAVNNDTTVVVYADWNDDWYVVAIKRDWETRTVWTPVSLWANVRFPRISSPYTWEFVVVYWDNTSVYSIAWSVSWTTITVWTKQQLLSSKPSQWGIWISRRNDNDNREFVVFYVKNDDKKIYYQICTYTSWLVITWWTEWTYLSSATNSWYIGVDYLWEWAAGVIYDAESGGTYYAYVWYSNMWSSSISSWNRYTLYSWTWAPTFFTPKSVKVKDGIYLVDTWDQSLWLFLMWAYWLGRPQWLIQSLRYNISPLMWRDYVLEDKDAWIIWMFGIIQIDWNYVIVYNRYKWSDTWLEFIDSVEYWAWNVNDVVAASRIWDTTCCSWLNYTDGELDNVLFQDESAHFVWINQEAATSWNSVDITYSWVVDTTWLTSWSEIYVWLDWTTATSWSKLIWLALSSTQALLK